MLRIALKGVLARKRRLLTTAIAVVFGVAFISGTAVLSDVLERSVNDLVDDAYRGVDAVIRSADAEEDPFAPVPIRKPIDDGLVEVAAAAEGARSAAGQIQLAATMLDADGEPTSSFGPPTFVTNYIEDDTLSSGRITEGEVPSGPDQAAIDFKTAEDMGFSLGDTVTVLVAQGASRFEVVGIGGIGEDGTKASGARVVLLDLPTVQQLGGMEGKVGLVTVAAEDGVSQVELVESLRALVTPDLEVVTGDAFVAENQAQIAQLTDIVTDLVAAFGWIAAFVGTFVIYNTFSILIAQRTREMALLRAVGASRRQIMGSVLVEAFATGVVAAALGLFAGFWLATAMKAFLGNLLSVPSGLPRLTPTAVWTSLLVGVVATVVSALLPAFRATRIPPVAAMSDVQSESRGVGRARIAAGVVLVLVGGASVTLGLTRTWRPPLQWIGIGGGLLFVALAVLGPVFAAPVSRLLGRPVSAMLGISGRLAQENAARNPKRTTATGVALTIGVALVTVITVVASSVSTSFERAYQEQLLADLVIDAGGFANPVPTNVREEVAEVEGVAAASSIRFTQVRFLDSKRAGELRQRSAEEQQRDPTGRGLVGVGGPVGEEMDVIATDPSALAAVVDLGELDPGPEALEPGTVFLTTTELEDNGWEVGDELRVWSTQSGETTWRISGTMTKSFGDLGALISYETYDQVTSPERRADSQVFVDVADDASVTAVADRVQERLDEIAPVARVQTVTEYIAEISSQIQTSLNIVYVLLGLAVVEALIGISNTIALSVFERTREIGLLRAVGMGRRQLRRAIRWEAAIIATFGSLLGLVMGAVFGALLVTAFATGDVSVTLHLPWGQLFVILVIGGLLGVVAAIRSARRAAKIDILAAIATE